MGCDVPTRGTAPPCDAAAEARERCSGNGAAAQRMLRGRARVALTPQKQHGFSSPPRTHSRGARPPWLWGVGCSCPSDLGLGCVVLHGEGSQCASRWALL